MSVPVPEKTGQTETKIMIESAQINKGPKKEALAMAGKGV